MIDRVQVKEAAAKGMPAPGRYRHFKGSEYELLLVARHSETEELLAVYCAVDEPERIWVRPVEMFAEQVCVSGTFKLRFEPAPEPPMQQASSKSFVLLRFLKRFGRAEKRPESESASTSYSRALSL